MSRFPVPAEIARGLQQALQLLQAGRSGPAARQLRDLAQAAPESFEVRHVLGAALVQQGRLQDAVVHLRRACELRPAALEAWLNLAAALQMSGAVEAAMETYDRAQRLQPANADVNYRLCTALLAAGQGEKALARADRFVAANPDVLGGQTTRAFVLARLGSTAEAVDAYRRVLSADPDNRLATYNLGVCLCILRRYEEAIGPLGRALEAQPNDASALEKLVAAKRACCDWQGIGELEQRLSAAAGAGAAGIDPFSIVIAIDDPEVLKRAAVGASRNLFQVQQQLAKPGRRSGADRIRIAYLSGDYRDHPVGQAIAGVIETHDRARFEVTAFSWGPDDRSAARQRLVAAFDRFEDVAGRDAAAIAGLVHSSGADIVVDLSGLSDSGNPAVLAFRPAPVQVSFLGYPVTTGAPWMDYVIADRIAVPSGAEREFTETLVRLPGCFFPPMRLETAARPDRAAAGLPATGTLLCCFNAAQKISPAVFDVWMRLLRDEPASVLWLPGGQARREQNLRAEAAARGIAPERIVFAARTSTVAEHLARLSHADLFLDTTPYNAHTTAMDALWAGVPVLTSTGRAFAGRVAASLLHAAGLPELVAPSLGAYEDLARDLMRSPARLAALKQHLCRGRDSLPVFNLAAYCRRLEAAYDAILAQAALGEKRPIDLAAGG